MNMLQNDHEKQIMRNQYKSTTQQIVRKKFTFAEKLSAFDFCLYNEASEKYIIFLRNNL